MILNLENKNAMDWEDLIATVNFYVYGQVIQEGVWDSNECTAITQDITMEAVKACLEQIQKGVQIRNVRAYIMATVKNGLRNEKYIAKCIIDRNSKSHDAASNQDYDDGFEYEETLEKTRLKTKYAEIDDAENDDLITISEHLKNCGLTSPEIKVAILCYQGFTGKEISIELGISAASVSRMLRLVKHKLT